MISEETKQTLILSLLGLNKEETGTDSKVGSNLDQRFTGRKVMVRTYSAGVHFGTLVEKSGQQAILKDSRRVYYWTHACSLSQLAIEGSKAIGDCKIAMSIPDILLDRVIEVIPMSDIAIENLYGAKEWKK